MLNTGAIHLGDARLQIFQSKWGGCERRFQIFLAVILGVDPRPGATLAERIGQGLGKPVRMHVDGHGRFTAAAVLLDEID